MTEPTIQAFFDSRTCTLTFVAWDEQTRDAVVIDPPFQSVRAAYRRHTKMAYVTLRNR